MSKPTIILVPGAWHSPEVYDGVIKYLSSRGYPTETVALPSVGADPPKADFTDDVAAIRARLTELIVSRGNDVVLVLHSYSGMPGNDASQGLGKLEREKSELAGGVLRLVFLAALIGFEGTSPMSSGAEIPKWMKVDFEVSYLHRCYLQLVQVLVAHTITQGGIVTVDEDDAKDLFYHDLLSDEVMEWTQKLKHQSLGVYTSPLTYAGWRYIPSTFVRAEGDRTVFSAPVVDAMLKAAREINPTAFDVVESTDADAGHMFMISRPEWLGEVLRRAAGEVIQE